MKMTEDEKRVVKKYMKKKFLGNFTMYSNRINHGNVLIRTEVMTEKEKKICIPASLVEGMREQYIKQDPSIDPNQVSFIIKSMPEFASIIIEACDPKLYLDYSNMGVFQQSRLEMGIAEAEEDLKKKTDRMELTAKDISDFIKDNVVVTLTKRITDTDKDILKVIDDIENMNNRIAAHNRSLDDAIDDLISSIDSLRVPDTMKEDSVISDSLQTPSVIQLKDVTPYSMFVYNDRIFFVSGKTYKSAICIQDETEDPVELGTKLTKIVADLYPEISSNMDLVAVIPINIMNPFTSISKSSLSLEVEDSEDEDDPTDDEA